MTDVLNSCTGGRDIGGIKIWLGGNCGITLFLEHILCKNLDLVRFPLKLIFRNSFAYGSGP